MNGPRPPTEAMVRYARALAVEHGVECPPEITMDFAACRAFLDEHASRKAANSETRSGTSSRKARAHASAGHSDGRAKTPAAKRSSHQRGGA